MPTDKQRSDWIIGRLKKRESGIDMYPDFDSGVPSIQVIKDSDHWDIYKAITFRQAIDAAMKPTPKVK